MSQRLSLGQAFIFLLRRDLLLALRNRAEYAMPLLFFVLVITMFPLALGALPELLARIAPGIVWVAALLAAMLSLDSIFRSDFDDGSLEQILLSAHPVAILVLAKVSAHWIVTGLPLLIVAPVLAEMLGMPAEAQAMRERVRAFLAEQIAAGAFVPGGEQGMIAALDKRSGELRWRSSRLQESVTYSSPIAATVEPATQNARTMPNAACQRNCGVSRIG